MNMLCPTMQQVSAPRHVKTTPAWPATNEGSSCSNNSDWRMSPPTAIIQQCLHDFCHQVACTPSRSALRSTLARW
jgi:hypothetical protein